MPNTLLFSWGKETPECLFTIYLNKVVIGSRKEYDFLLNRRGKQEYKQWHLSIFPGLLQGLCLQNDHKLNKGGRWGEGKNLLLFFWNLKNELFSKNFWFLKKCLLTPWKSQKINQSRANWRGLVVVFYKHAYMFDVFWGLMLHHFTPSLLENWITYEK